MKLYCKTIEDNFKFNPDFLKELELKEKSEICFEYISDFKSTKVIRDFVEVLSDKIKIDKIWKSRLILIIDELNNNAIEYWSKHNEKNIFRIYIEKTGNSKVNLTIEVEDTWNWPHHKTAKEMEELRKQRKNIDFSKHDSIRWRWLFLIIEKLVDKLYFKDSKKWWLIVWVKKTLEIKN